MLETLVPRLCLGTHCSRGSASPFRYSSHRSITVPNKRAVGACRAVRYQAEPGNEKKNASALFYGKGPDPPPLSSRGAGRFRFLFSGFAASMKRMASFVDPELADEMGLVAIGGDLAPRRLLEAYCSGIFPWFDEGGPVLWWSPDPRAILEMDGLHISRRLARTLRSGKFHCTVDQAFSEVIRGCADREEGTWITSEMIAAYERLHQLGWAHSIEAWIGGVLAGGLYGVAIRGLFAAESMFTCRTDGSKVALAFLMDHLRRVGVQLLDIQMVTKHTTSLGAIEIPRREYLSRLKMALVCDVRFGEASAPYTET